MGKRGGGLQLNVLHKRGGSGEFGFPPFAPALRPLTVELLNINKFFIT